MRLRQVKIIILLTPFFLGCQLNNKNSIDNKFKLEKNNSVDIRSVFPKRKL